MSTTQSPSTHFGVGGLIMAIALVSVSHRCAGASDGVLRRHPANPRYVTDDSGTAIFLTGSHTWWNVQKDPDSPVAVPTSQSFSNYLDWMQSHGHNFTRLWVGLSYLGCEPYPWSRTGPGTAHDDGPKFDMTSMNESYFDVVRERVLQVQGRGMYCSVMFFGSHNRMKSNFPGTAWHPENNVNPELASAFDPDDGYSFFTTDAVAREIQRQLVRTFIDELNDVDNMMWEIINEPGGTAAAVAWHKDMVEYAKSYEATKPKQHLVGMTGGWGLGTEMLTGVADWISPDWDAYSTTGPGDYHQGGPAAYSDKVVINDTDHLWGYSDLVDVEDHRKWVWKTLCRGNHPIYMDPYDANQPDHDNHGEVNPGFDPPRKAMGYALVYAHKVDLAAALPDETVASTGYCLAEPGMTYLVYQPGSGAFTVDLQPGEYDYEWFDPTTGTVAGTGSLRAPGGDRSFTPPFGGDAVLHLSSSATGGDADGDGLTDDDESNVHGTDPTDADTDDDGMSDGDEVAGGLDPLNTDQDANGVPDGQDDWDGDGVDNATEAAAGTSAGTPPDDPQVGAAVFSCEPGGAGPAPVHAAALVALGLGLVLARATTAHVMQLI